MSRRLQENIVATVILTVFMVYLITTLSFGNNARLVPFPIAILGIVLVLIQLVKQNLTEKEKLEVEEKLDSEIKTTQEQSVGMFDLGKDRLAWPALLRKLERYSPDYKI